jgi:hypothetical protein
MQSIRVAVALSLALIFGACRGKAPGPSASGDGGPPPRSSNRETYEDRFQIGRTATADGIVTAETDKFTAGDPIHIVFVVRNAPAGASAKVIWKRIDGNVSMGEEQKPLPSSGFVWFAVKDTSAWPPGAYRVEKLFSREASSTTPTQWKGLGTKDLTISPR